MTLGSYPVFCADALPSPSVLVFRAYLERNLDRMVALAGGPERLRPHCKTHKTREIVRLLLERGVQRHKCATPREVQLCLEAGARDVVLAYQPVGPSVEQLVALAERTPDARLGALVDCEAAAEALARAAVKRGVTIGALVDLDTGLHRTGIAIGDEAAALYAFAARQPGLRPAGLHVYDAQNNSYHEAAERQQAVERTLGPVLAFADRLRMQGLDVPEIVCGGSGTFHYHAQHDGPITVSPGTCVFWDYGYSQRFPELDKEFVPAALLFGRVVSRPAPRHVTLDVGNKAIAADPPVGKRGLILGLEDAETLVHNEEHWALMADGADRYRVGDTVLIVPAHVCPCTNLHPWLQVIDQEWRLAGRWEVASRQRTPVEDERA